MPFIRFQKFILESQQLGSSNDHIIARVYFQIDAFHTLHESRFQQSGQIKPTLTLPAELAKFLNYDDMLKEVEKYYQCCFASAVGGTKALGQNLKRSGHTITRQWTTSVRTTAQEAPASSNLPLLRVFVGLNNIKIETSSSFTLGRLHLSSMPPDFKGDEISIFGRMYTERFPLPWFGLQRDFFETLDFYDTENFQDCVYAISNTIESFLTSLWFVKDHGVNNQTLFSSCEAEGCYLHPSNLYSNIHSSGVIQETEFTYKELALAEVKMHAIDKITSTSIPGKPFKVQSPNETGSITELSHLDKLPYNTHNRITRALRFTEAARRTGMLPMKIAFYIGALECIFTTDNREVTHKVSERTSFLVGRTPDEKLKIFQNVKRAYDVRSSYMHGDKLTSKSESDEALTEISITIDEIVRKVLNIVVDDSSLTPDDKGALADRFLKIILKLK